jgi:DNA-binding response OmpR family regulator/two-component sensor histidine kinase
MMQRADHSSSGEILVVEDTPASLKLLSELLGNAGYLVRQAPDGELALWSAQARPPELILLDIRMPGIDGFEVCRRLKADPALSDIPVIFLSAQYDTDDKVRGFQAGAVDFIAKPYQSEEVLARTRAHIHLARAQQALAASNAQLTRTLEELGTARAEIVRSERLAALGALVAGVAHELNTPIGNSVLAASALQDRSSAFFGGIEHGVKRSELERFGADTEHATTLLLRNLHKAADLIECFKQVAVDQTSSQRRSFELATLVVGMAKTLAPSLRAAGAELRVEAAGGLAMDSYPGALCQVLTQLTSNAVLHAFAQPDSASRPAPGAITIRMAADGGAVRLEFEDNGAGFPAGGLARAFEPFNTGSMGRSSGLGLHIVHNLVTNVLGGAIELASAPGRTRFAMRLPLDAPALGRASNLW